MHPALDVRQDLLRRLVVHPQFLLVSSLDSWISVQCRLSDTFPVLPP
jgi:hypothetical protein